MANGKLIIRRSAVFIIYKLKTLQNSISKLIKLYVVCTCIWYQYDLRNFVLIITFLFLSSSSITTPVHHSHSHFLLFVTKKESSSL